MCGQDLEALEGEKASAEAAVDAAAQAAAADLGLTYGEKVRPGHNDVKLNSACPSNYYAEGLPTATNLGHWIFQTCVRPRA